MTEAETPTEIAQCLYCAQNFERPIPKRGTMRSYCSDQCRESAKYQRKKRKKQGLPARVALYPHTMTEEEVLAEKAASEARIAAARERRDRAMAERQERIAEAIAQLSDVSALPADVVPREQIQAAIGLVVAQSMTDAMKVMAGTKKWSSQQTAIFKLMLDRVVPPAQTEKLKLNERAKKKLDEMSADELEALLAEHVDGKTLNEGEDE